MKYFLIAITTVLCALVFLIPVHAMTSDEVLYFPETPNEQVIEVAQNGVCSGWKELQAGGNIATAVDNIQANSSMSAFNPWIRFNYQSTTSLPVFKLKASYDGTYFLHDTFNQSGFEVYNYNPQSTLYEVVPRIILYLSSYGQEIIYDFSDCSGIQQFIYDARVQYILVDSNVSIMGLDTESLPIFNITNPDLYQSIQSQYYNSGWDAGYSDGMDNNVNVETVIEKTLGTVMNTFTTLFDIDIFGFNILNVIALFSGCAIIIYLIKMIRGL